MAVPSYPALTLIMMVWVSWVIFWKNHHHSGQGLSVREHRYCEAFGHRGLENVALDRLVSLGILKI